MNEKMKRKWGKSSREKSEKKKVDCSWRERCKLSQIIIEFNFLFRLTFNLIVKVSSDDQ